MYAESCLVSHSAATARASGAQRVTEAEYFQNSTNISSPGMQIMALDTFASYHGVKSSRFSLLRWRRPSSKGS